MKKIIEKVVSKFELSLRRIGFEGIGFSILMFTGVLFINVNTLRVFNNANENLNVYEREKSYLEKLEAENKELQSDLDITSSEEYKKILARQILGLAQSDESLYKLDTDTDFYDLKIEYLDINEKNDYSDWWLLLVN